MTPDRRRGPHILLAGGLWYPYDPRPEDVRISDLMAIGRVHRFSASFGEYSVMDHSLRVSALLRERGHDRRTQLAGLIHDAHGAYVGDTPAPVKSPAREMPLDAAEMRRHRIAAAICELERMAEDAVRAAFGFTPETWPAAAVRIADLDMCAVEARGLCGAASGDPHDEAIWGKALLARAPGVRFEAPRNRATVASKFAAELMRLTER